MGWIADRHMKRGGSIGPGGLGKRKKGAPLRTVVAILVPQESIFTEQHVRYDCGHEGKNWGGVKGRCVKCKEEAEAKETEK